MPHLVHLATQDVGGKGARIDRCAQILPEMRNRADVILMRMGNENCLKLVFARCQPSDIGQDKVNPWAAVHIGEGQPQINQNKALCARFSIAINIGVHANFTSPSKGQVDQSFTAHLLRFSCIIIMHHGETVHGKRVVYGVK